MMKRALWFVLTLVAVVPFSGCIAASVHDNEFTPSKQAVSHEGTVYLVDTVTGKAEIVDLSDAEPFKPERIDD